MQGITTAGYDSRDGAIKEVLRQEAAKRERKERWDSRLVTALLLLTLGLCASVAGNIFQSQQGVREVAHAYFIDHEANVTPMIRLNELTVDPPDSMVRSVLMMWTECIRPISSDPKVMADNRKRCDAFMTEAAIKQLEEFRAEQKARQEQRIRVEITQPDVRAIPKTRSYTVKWDERTYGPSGNLILKESARWTATLTIGEFHTKAAKEALNLRIKKKEHRNLLGILIDGISWEERPLYGHTRDPEDK